MNNNKALLAVLKVTYELKGKPRTDDMIIHEALSQLLFKADRKAWYQYMQKREAEL